MIPVQPDYTINVDGADVHFVFNTYALRRYCESERLELQSLYEKVSNSFQEEGTGGFVIHDLPKLLLHGNAAYRAYNNGTGTATGMEVDQWIDWIGGLQEQTQAFIGILVLIAARMLSGEKKRTSGTPVTNPPNASPGDASAPLPLRAD